MKYYWFFIILLLGCNGGKKRLTERLVYVKYQDQKFDIYSADMLGQWEHQITNDSQIEQSPKWNNTLKKITYQTILIDSTQVFLSLENEKRDTLHRGSFLDIHLHKEGMTIYYSQPSENGIQIWKKNRTDNSSELFIEYPGLDGSFALSEDGEFLAFLSTETGNMEVYIVSLTSKKIRQVTDSQMNKRFLSWSPNGEDIAFCMASSKSKTDWDIFILNINDGSLEQLTKTPYAETHISFSLTGTRMAFHANTQNDGDQIYTLGIYDRKFTKLTSGKNRHFEPSWTPDETFN